MISSIIKTTKTQYNFLILYDIHMYVKIDLLFESNYDVFLNWLCNKGTRFCEI